MDARINLQYGDYLHAEPMQNDNPQQKSKGINSDFCHGSTVDFSN